MKGYDATELKIIKSRRQEKLLSENPPERIINVLRNPENNSTLSKIEEIAKESKDKKEKLVHNYQRTSTVESIPPANVADSCPIPEKRPKSIKIEATTKDGEVHLGKFKLSSSLQLILLLFGILMGLATTWVDLNNTINSNTERIIKLEEELASTRKTNNDVFGFLTNDMDNRITAIEKEIYNFAFNNDSNTAILRSDINRMKTDIDDIKLQGSINITDITSILRDLGRLESKIDKLTK